MAGIEDLYPQFSEFARRSARNLGPAVDFVKTGLGFDLQAMADQARANNAAIGAGADATRKLMAGDDLTDTERDALHGSPAGGFGTDAGGGGAFAATYVGRNAANVPKRALTNAQKAATGGMDNEAIRQKYGWFQDPSGDWKFEISDHRAELRVDPNDPNSVKLYHPELRRQYPDLVDTLKIGDLPNQDALGRPNPTVAEYRRDTNTANINWSEANTPQEALKVLLHELQHGVQFREGFSPGTNQRADEIGHLVNTEYWPQWEAADWAVINIQKEREKWLHGELAKGNHMTIEDFDRRFPDWDKRYREAIKARNTFPDISTWTFQKYNSALGEVEARDTMNRMDLTPDQRRAKKPYEGEGIPWTDIWDIREIQEAMRPPRKVADTPEEPPDVQSLIKRHLGLLPE